jgi:hypothetical protein
VVVPVKDRPAELARLLTAPRADPATLEDLAYGAGLCWGAVRNREPRALLPARPPRRSGSTGPERNAVAPE